MIPKEIKNRMWIERSPKENETVKVEFADWTNLGIQIGICVGHCNKGAKILFGDCIRVLSGTMFVFKPC